MSKKLYNMLIGYKDAKPGELHWWEECWLDCTPKEMMRRFNSSLHPNERVRKVIDYEILEGVNKPHTWRKSNLVTVSNAGKYYDIYKCKVCGVTGKRFTLGSFITIDKKYKKRIYCESK